MDDLLSIIVPIYNIDQYVGFCIESLIKQTYRNLEIILVDDGSTDRSGALCDLYRSKDSRIKVIHKENGGLVSARKAGVQIASGSYIGNVDGDDWVEPDFFEVLHRAAVKAEADIVCAGYSRDFFDQHVKCTNNILDGIYEGDGLEKLYTQMMAEDDCFTIGVTTYVWNKLFKTDIVREVQLAVDEGITIGEDSAVTYPAMLKAKRVYVCDNSSYHYRQREGSMLKIQDNFDVEREKIKRMYEYLEKVFAKDERNEMLLKQLERFSLGYFIMRSGGILDKGKSNAFGVDFEGKKVAVVLAGTFGQMVYNRLNSTGYCEVVGWYDDDYWEYRRCGMNVDPLDEIDVSEVDYALIAKTNGEDIEWLKERLKAISIKNEQVLSISLKSLSSIRNSYLMI